MAFFLALVAVIAAHPQVDAKACQLHDGICMVQVTRRLANGRDRMPRRSEKELTDSAHHSAQAPVGLEWSEARLQVWSDHDCPNIGNTVEDLAGCKLSCSQTLGCNAINHCYGTNDCILRKCGTPVAPPNWQDTGYQGYNLQQSRKWKVEAEAGVPASLPLEVADEQTARKNGNVKGAWKQTVFDPPQYPDEEFVPIGRADKEWSPPQAPWPAQANILNQTLSPPAPPVIGNLSIDRLGYGKTGYSLQDREKNQARTNRIAAKQQLADIKQLSGVTSRRSVGYQANPTGAKGNETYGEALNAAITIAAAAGVAAGVY